ncbi:hypothetical protein FRB95_013009 [Tulasnella sp. JGI-2019a]|nr:hypothetical protein FRB95_013009 [Tulasnella sp. JGI-2019a]
MPLPVTFSSTVSPATSSAGGNQGFGAPLGQAPVGGSGGNPPFSQPPGGSGSGSGGGSPGPGRGSTIGGYPIQGTSGIYMKHDIKIELIPKLEDWDNFVGWIQKITNIVCMGGTLMSDVAKMVPTHLKGEVAMWYIVQSNLAKDWLMDTWDNFFQGVLHFLGPTWMMQKWQEMLAMNYHQLEHKKEKPLKFFVQKLRLAWLMVNVLDSPGLVEFLTTDMPVEWNHYLHPENLANEDMLLTLANQHEAVLISVTENQ